MPFPSGLAGSAGLGMNPGWSLSRCPEAHTPACWRQPALRCQPGCLPWPGVLRLATVSRGCQ